MKKVLLILLTAFFYTAEAIQAPDFALKDETGRTLKLSDLKDDVVFLTFWATTCHSCRDELPLISKNLYPRYKDKVKFFAIVIDSDSPRQTTQIKKEWGFDLPVLFGNSEVMEKYRIIGTPITYVIGKNNTIVKIFIGPQSLDKFQQAVKKALGEG